VKRRQFLTGAACAGTLLREIASADIGCVTDGQRPGSSDASDCTQSDAQKDWLRRSTGSGVVWAHDFATAAEVNQFRWAGGYGNDPDATQQISRYVTWNPDDGIPGTAGRCLQILRPAGATDPGQWVRPFSALRAGDNGLSNADPGAGGQIAPLPFKPNEAGVTDRWINGGYANADYHTGGPGADDYTYDGTDFYLQMRAKISRSRWQGGNQAFDGKFCVYQVTGKVSAFDLVQHNTASGVYKIYTAFGSPGPREFLFIPQSSTPGYGTSYQPGGKYSKSCVYTGNAPGPDYYEGRKRSCWLYPADSWFTVLVHVIPGHVTAEDWGTADWGIQIWVAPHGEKTYTLVYDVPNYQFFYYPAGILRGWNAIILNSYFNHQNMPLAFTQSYTQIIFSQQFIECPQF
jgi:hypothetical protein